MRYQAHRGVSSEASENTMSSFIYARKQGYDVIELDPNITKDGIFVVLHDDTINRTGRRLDQKEIKEDTKIFDMNYEELKDYEFGSSFSPKFKGEKIPLFEDVLRFSKENDILLKIDNKIFRLFQGETLHRFFKLIKESKAKVAITCQSVEYIQKAVEELKNCEIHYDGPISDEILPMVKKASKNHPLTIWAPLKNRLTTWVKVPFINQEYAKKIKKYGDLGIWLLETEEEKDVALSYGADIIETTGSIKPDKAKKAIFDMHTHTENSHDSICSPVTSCLKAIEHYLNGIAFTDHCDIEFYRNIDVITPIIKSVYAAKLLDEVCNTQLSVLKGIELGEGLWDLEGEEKAEKANDYDVIIRSVHAVRSPKDTRPYSQIDFSTWKKEEIEDYLTQYFKDLLETLETLNSDVMAHLTCPLRYINGKYHLHITLEKQQDLITKILSTIIRKGIALEVNTSNMQEGKGFFFMPDEKIIQQYYEMGGYLITLGSDAHVADNSALYFKEAISLLKKIGFRYIYHYENRIPIPDKL